MYKMMKASKAAKREEDRLHAQEATELAAAVAASLQSEQLRPEHLRASSVEENKLCQICMVRTKTCRWIMKESEVECVHGLCEDCAVQAIEISRKGRKHPITGAIERKTLVCYVCQQQIDDSAGSPMYVRIDGAFDAGVFSGTVVHLQ